MPATFKRIEITEQFLNEHKDAYFVYGDNLQRTGLGGAAKLRPHPRAIGFVTKKAPDDHQKSFFRPEEYASMFFDQLKQLENIIKANPNNIYYISKLGSGLANRHRIWELLIRHNIIDDLRDYNNVVFCWDEREDDFK